MGQTLYLECSSGISGDMAVAALLDLGADEKILRKALESLPVKGFEIEISRVKKSGLDACDFNVKLDKHHENHDHDMEYLHGHHYGHHHENEAHDALPILTIITKMKYMSMDIATRRRNMHMSIMSTEGFRKLKQLSKGPASVNVPRQRPAIFFEFWQRQRPKRTELLWSRCIFMRWEQ